MALAGFPKCEEICWQDVDLTLLAEKIARNQRLTRQERLAALYNPQVCKVNEPPVRGGRTGPQTYVPGAGLPTGGGYRQVRTDRRNFCCEPTNGYTPYVATRGSPVHHMDVPSAGSSAGSLVGTTRLVSSGVRPTPLGSAYAPTAAGSHLPEDVLLGSPTKTHPNSVAFANPVAEPATPTRAPPLATSTPVAGPLVPTSPYHPPAPSLAPSATLPPLSAPAGPLTSLVATASPLAATQGQFSAPSTTQYASSPGPAAMPGGSLLGSGYSYQPPPAAVTAPPPGANLGYSPQQLQQVPAGPALPYPTYAPLSPYRQNAAVTSPYANAPGAPNAYAPAPGPAPAPARAPAGSFFWDPSREDGAKQSRLPPSGPVAAPYPAGGPTAPNASYANGTYVPASGGSYAPYPTGTSGGLLWGQPAPPQYRAPGLSMPGPQYATGSVANAPLGVPVNNNPFRPSSGPSAGAQSRSLNLSHTATGTRHAPTDEVSIV